MPPSPAACPMEYRVARPSHEFELKAGHRVRVVFDGDDSYIRWPATAHAFGIMQRLVADGVLIADCPPVAPETLRRAVGGPGQTPPPSPTPVRHLRLLP